MKIGPLKRPQQRPVAILQPGHRTLEVTTETGTHTYKGSQACAEALAGLSGHVCYVLSHLADLVHTTGALSWTCHLWRGRETRMTHVPSGTQVGTLRGTLKHSLIYALCWIGYLAKVSLRVLFLRWHGHCGGLRSAVNSASALMLRLHRLHCMGAGRKHPDPLSIPIWRTLTFGLRTQWLWPAGPMH